MAHGPINIRIGLFAFLLSLLFANFICFSTPSRKNETVFEEAKTVVLVCADVAWCVAKLAL